MRRITAAKAARMLMTYEREIYNPIQAELEARWHDPEETADLGDIQHAAVALDVIHEYLRARASAAYQAERDRP